LVIAVEPGASLATDHEPAQHAFGGIGRRADPPIVADPGEGGPAL